METKVCAMCKESKPWSEFSIRPSGKPVAYCKDPCRKIYSKKDYKKNRSKILDGQRLRRDKLRIKLWDYLDTHPCVDCGEDDPIVLEFDHIDPSTKLHAVSHMLSTKFLWKEIEDEIAKCEVRCSNCHKKRTAIQFGWYKFMGTR